MCIYSLLKQCPLEQLDLYRAIIKQIMPDFICGYHITEIVSPRSIAPREEYLIIWCRIEAAYKVPTAQQDRTTGIPCAIHLFCVYIDIINLLSVASIGFSVKKRFSTSLFFSCQLPRILSIVQCWIKADPIIFTYKLTPSPMEETAPL